MYIRVNCVLSPSPVVSHCFAETTAAITRGWFTIYAHTETHTCTYTQHTHTTGLRHLVCFVICIDGGGCQGDELGFEKTKIISVRTSAEIMHQI